jgi:hypothetical protein
MVSELVSLAGTVVTPFHQHLRSPKVRVQTSLLRLYPDMLLTFAIYSIEWIRTWIRMSLGLPDPDPSSFVRIRPFHQQAKKSKEKP